VLRSVCAAEHCGSDPAADLSVVLNRLHDGPALLDALVADSVVAPDYPGVIDALRAARAGRPGALEALIAAVRRGESSPARFLSQGLHESTLCLELASPWCPAELRTHSTERPPPATASPRAASAGRRHNRRRSPTAHPRPSFRRYRHCCRLAGTTYRHRWRGHARRPRWRPTAGCWKCPAPDARYSSGLAIPRCSGRLASSSAALSPPSSCAAAGQILT
jgi:hypothetical protein